MTDCAGSAWQREMTPPLRGTHFRRRILDAPHEVATGGRGRLQVRPHFGQLVQLLIDLAKTVTPI